MERKKRPVKERVETPKKEKRLNKRRALEKGRVETPMKERGESLKKRERKHLKKEKKWREEKSMN